MSKENEIREMVAGAYEEALRRSREGKEGCCGTKVCSGPGEAADAAAVLAGYEAEIETHPEAAARSFGCGNPLAFAGVEELACRPFLLAPSVVATRPDLARILRSLRGSCRLLR